MPNVVAAWGLYSFPSGPPAPTADASVPVLGPNDFAPGDSFWHNHDCNVDSGVYPDPWGSINQASKLRDTFVDDGHYLQESDGTGSVVSRPFKSGRTYTVGVWVHAQDLSTPGVGPMVDFGSGHVIGCRPGVTGSIGGIVEVSAPSGPVASVSAELFDANNNAYWCVALSFKLSSDASGTFCIALNAGHSPLDYVGALGGHHIWGAFCYADELLDSETFEAGWMAWIEPYARTLLQGGNALSAVWGNGTVNTVQNETFEGGWSNNGFAFTLPTSLTGAALFNEAGTPHDFDGFGATAATGGWDTTYQTTIGSSTACLFNEAGTPHDFEGFGGTSATGGWDVTYQTTIGSSTQALWSGGFSMTAEGFEVIQPDVLYVATAPSTFTSAAHNLGLNTIVRVINVGGTFPTGLIRTLDYYTVNVTTNTFQLSLTASGAAVTFSDVGSGDNSVRASGKNWWNGPDLYPGPGF